MVNHALSFFPDTVFQANWANLNSHLPIEQQYSYYLGAVRKGSRFRKGKWGRAEDANLKLVKQVYSFSSEKAAWALRLLTEAQLDELRKTTETGGTKK